MVEAFASLKTKEELLAEKKQLTEELERQKLEQEIVILRKKTRKPSVIDKFVAWAKGYEQ